MNKPQAWRIYHLDAVNKQELTQSPARVKEAREAGRVVVELVELHLIIKALALKGLMLVETDSGYVVETYMDIS